MKEFNEKKIQGEMDRLFENNKIEYQKKAEEHMNSLDFDKLEKIKNKSITEITEDDLIYIGFKRISDKDFDILYNYRDFDDIKIYFHRLSDRFELLGFRLMKVKDIFTIQELLDSSLTRWKLKLYR